MTDEARENYVPPGRGIPIEHVIERWMVRSFGFADKVPEENWPAVASVLTETLRQSGWIVSPMPERQRFALWVDGNLLGHRLERFVVWLARRLSGDGIDKGQR